MARLPKSACEIGIPIGFDPKVFAAARTITLTGSPLELSSPTTIAYNDGRPVEPEVIAEIFRALDIQFGGVTNKGIHEGSWFGQVEQSLRLEVDVEPGDVHMLEKVVYAIGKRLGQKEMYFNVPAPSVRNVVIEDVATGTRGE